MSIEIPINVNMKVEESQMAFDMEVDEDINVTVIQGTDVSDTTAVEADVLSGKKFHKADGNLATGSLVLPTSAPFNDVNFYDYDGTIVYSYSASDFASLSDLPANPVHDGLTAQGWNWTLADAKMQVAASGFLDIGQMYKSSDGKTRLYIRIIDILATNIRLYISQTVGRGVSVDWGDGSDAETISGTGVKSANHTYSLIGDYVITLTVTSGTMKLGGTSASSQIITNNSNADGNPRACRNTLVGIVVGDNCEYNTLALYDLQSLQFAVVSSSSSWMSNAYLCRQINHITIPSGYSGAVYARGAYALKTISIPKSVSGFETSGFDGCVGLTRFLVLSGITTLNASLLYGCTSLVSIVVPSSVTSIGDSAFRACSGLMEIHFKSTTPPTLGGSNVFTNVPTTCKIYVPSGSLSAYTSAPNYPSSETYTYIEE